MFCYDIELRESEYYKLRELLYYLDVECMPNECGYYDNKTKERMIHVVMVVNSFTYQVINGFLERLKDEIL